MTAATSANAGCTEAGNGHGDYTLAGTQTYAAVSIISVAAAGAVTISSSSTQLIPPLILL